MDTVRQSLAATGAQANSAALGSLAVVGGATLLGLIPYLFVLMVPAVVVGVVLARRGFHAADSMNGRGRTAAVTALLLVPVALAACTAGFFFTRAIERTAARTQPIEAADVDVKECRIVDSTVVVSGTITNPRDVAASAHLAVNVDVSRGGPLLIQFDLADIGPGATASFADSRFTVASVAKCTAVGAWKLDR